MGEDADFAAFVRTRYPALARSAFLLTGDRGHAEDLAQSALVQTMRSWSRLRSTDAALTYTRTTMVRLAARAARRRWRGEIPTDADALDVGTHVEDISVALDVRRVLADLPWPQRAVLVLRYLDDLSEADTAAALGCSVGTVKSRASRALAVLRSSGLLTEETAHG